MSYFSDTVFRTNIIKSIETVNSWGGIQKLGETEQNENIDHTIP